MLYINESHLSKSNALEMPFILNYSQSIISSVKNSQRENMQQFTDPNNKLQHIKNKQCKAKRVSFRQDILKNQDISILNKLKI